MVSLEQKGHLCAAGLSQSSCYLRGSDDLLAAKFTGILGIGWAKQLDRLFS